MSRFMRPAGLQLSASSFLPQSPYVASTMPPQQPSATYIQPQQQLPYIQLPGAIPSTPNVTYMQPAGEVQIDVSQVPSGPIAMPSQYLAPQPASSIGMQSAMAPGPSVIQLPVATSASAQIGTPVYPQVLSTPPIMPTPQAAAMPTPTTAKPKGPRLSKPVPKQEKHIDPLLGYFPFLHRRQIRPHLPTFGNLTDELKLEEVARLRELVAEHTVTIQYPLLISHPGYGGIAADFGLDWAPTKGTQPGIRNIILIENNRATLDTLQEVMSAYGIRGVDYVSSFDRVPETYYGGVGIFIPKTNYKRFDPNVSQEQQLQLWQQKYYIGASGRLADFQEVVMKTPNLQLSLFLVPLGFPLPNISGYQVTSKVVKSFLVLILKSTAGQAIANSRFPGRAEFANAWTKELFIYLGQLLPKIFGAEAAVFLQPQWRDIWIKAFTHESYDSDRRNNYDALEALGDKTIKGAWGAFIANSYPDFTEGEMTQLENNFMSQRGQPALAIKMGLLRYVRKGPVVKKEEKIPSDIFESVAGAIVTITDKVEGPGRGLYRVYQYILYNFPEPPSRDAAVDAKSKVKQALESLWFYWEGEGAKITSVGSGLFEGVLEVSESFRDFLRLWGQFKPLESKVLGRARNSDQQKAKSEMFEDAWKTLQHVGLDQYIGADLASKIIINPDDYPVVDALVEKMRLKNARKLYVSWLSEGNSYRVQLWEMIDDGRSNYSNRRRQSRDSAGQLMHVVATDIGAAKQQLVEWYLR